AARAEALVDALMGAMTTVLGGVSALGGPETLSQPSAAKESVVLTPALVAEVKAAAEHLRDLLAAYDPAADDAAGALLEQVRGTAVEPTMASVVRHAGAFDFDDAIAALDRLANELLP
ncbi:MAG: hypothetical protein VR70_18640, partial [Rhodospirillaceae bacterium BRH_c57]